MTVLLDSITMLAPSTRGRLSDMIIIDRCRLSSELSGDYISMEETGEDGEQELNHSDGEAEYQEVKDCARMAASG